MFGAGLQPGSELRIKLGKFQWPELRIIRWPVTIAIRDRLDMVCIEVTRSGARGGHPIDIGRTFSMCGTAVGRAYLAACSPAEREGLLNQLRVKSPQEWARHKTSLLKNLADYPGTGYCLSLGEAYPDVQAVAVPLGRVDRGELAAINVSFQRRALDERWLVEQVAPQLAAFVRRLG